MSDNIVGTWMIEKIIVTYSDGQEKENYRSECDQEIRHSYFANGTLQFKMVSTDKETGECVFQKDDHFTGTWKRYGRIAYEMHFVTKFESGQVTEYDLNTAKYDFGIDGQTFTRHLNYQEEGIIFGEGNVPISEKTTYRRVQ